MYDKTKHQKSHVYLQEKNVEVQTIPNSYIFQNIMVHYEYEYMANPLSRCCFWAQHE